MGLYQSRHHHWQIIRFCDRAGLKSLKIGGAIVSDKHANFIIAEKGCRSRDVMRLIEAIKQRVKEQFDTELELEIEIWD